MTLLRIRTFVHHIVEAGSNDKVGYFGDDPGVTVTCPAGSIAVFTSVNFHCSGANTTDRLRRVYLAQSSAEPAVAVETIPPARVAARTSRIVVRVDDIGVTPGSDGRSGGTVGETPVIARPQLRVVRLLPGPLLFLLPALLSFWGPRIWHEAS